MHTLSTHPIVIPGKRAQASATRDPWQGQAPSLSMDPRVKPEGDNLSVLRNGVAISSAVVLGLEPSIQGKRSSGGGMDPRDKPAGDDLSVRHRGCASPARQPRP